MTLQELASFQDRVVILNLTDGERLKCKLAWVNIHSEYNDVIVDVLETNHPEHYKEPEALYTIECAMIQSIEICEAQNSN